MLHTRISNDNIHRAHIIAEYMYNNADKYYLSSVEMYLLGLTHCIGLIKGNYNFEGEGYNILFSMNYPFADIIKNQSLTPKQYKTIHQCSDAEIPKELVLLWEANMHVNSDGFIVGFVTRLDDLEAKLGATSAEFNAYKETILWLETYSSCIDLMRAEHIIFPDTPINVVKWLANDNNNKYACIGDLETKELVCYCDSDDVDVLTGMSMIYDKDFSDGNYFWCGPTIFENDSAKQFKEPVVYNPYDPHNDELLNRVMIE